MNQPENSKCANGEEMPVGTEAPSKERGWHIGRLTRPYTRALALALACFSNAPACTKETPQSESTQTAVPAELEKLRERYDFVGDFHEDAAVVEKDGKYFHIGRDGKPLYAERYDFVLDFYEGAAIVEKDGKYFHIGKDGKPLYAERYDFVLNFHEGVAIVMDDGRRFYIGKDGKHLP